MLRVVIASKHRLDGTITGICPHIGRRRSARILTDRAIATVTSSFVEFQTTRHESDRIRTFSIAHGSPKLDQHGNMMILETEKEKVLNITPSDSLSKHSNAQSEKERKMKEIKVIDEDTFTSSSSSLGAMHSSFVDPQSHSWSFSE